jgi:hypothetical protein
MRDSGNMSWAPCVRFRDVADIRAAAHSCCLHSLRAAKATALIVVILHVGDPGHRLQMWNLARAILMEVSQSASLRPCSFTTLPFCTTGAAISRIPRVPPTIGAISMSMVNPLRCLME